MEKHKMENPDLLTVADLETRLQLSKPTIYKLMKEGLPSLKIGKNRRFRLDDVLFWLERKWQGKEQQGSKPDQEKKPMPSDTVRRLEETLKQCKK